MPNEPKTVLEHKLQEMKSAGANVHFAPRTLKASGHIRGANANAFEHWIPQWIHNSYRNFPVICESPGIGILARCAKKLPAIVVGIGPSLDDYIEDLRYAQNHAVIIATDAAVRPLMAHHVRPDLVINLDARDKQHTMWETVDTSGLILVTHTGTSPVTLNEWKGRTIFYNLRQNDSAFHTNVLPIAFPTIGTIDSCGTVGNMAIALANFMGCDPILGMGMDFSYRQEKDREGAPIGAWRYRCTDWRLDPPSAEQGVPERWVPTENKLLYDNDERLRDAVDHTISDEAMGVKQVYKTDPDLLFYLGAFQKLIGEWNINFVDCSDGLLRHYVRQMRLPRALDEYCPRELSALETTAKHLARIL